MNNQNIAWHNQPFFPVPFLIKFFPFLSNGFGISSWLSFLKLSFVDGDYQ